MYSKLYIVLLVGVIIQLVYGSVFVSLLLAQQVPIDSVDNWNNRQSNMTYSIAWGDVDGDGDLDLACGNIYGPNMLYRNINGRLETNPSWTSSKCCLTYSVTWGDVDGDGDLDLACGNWDEQNTIYINKNGQLADIPSWSSALSNVTKSVSWGDVDGDGDLDLACGNIYQSNTVYLNYNGQLETTPDWESTYKYPTNSVSWGDVDGDGDLDLACGNYGEPNTVYLNSNGHLETEPSWKSDISYSKYTMSICWGDVDMDGDLDLACGTGGPNTVYLNRDGQLETLPSWSSTPRYNTLNVCWGDVDGDGDLDLACGNPFEEPITIYINNNGKLESSPSWHVTSSNTICCVAWGDMDGDGDLDLACGKWDGPNTLYLNYNNVRMDNVSSWTSTSRNYTSSIFWGDVDRDGDLDLACGNYYQSNTLYVNNNGNLEKLPYWKSNASHSTKCVEFGDIDGDGDLDLACGNWGKPNMVYINNNGQLAGAPGWNSVPSSKTNVVRWGDVDGDGDLDLACGNWEEVNTIYLNMNGQLDSIPSWRSSLTSKTYDVRWGDVDGDGDLDLACGNGSELNTVYFNDNGRLENTPSWRSHQTNYTQSVCWGDVDGDGDLDLVCGNDGSNTIYFNNNGKLETLPNWISEPANRTFSIDLGDVDGDGDLDLACGNWEAPNTIYINNNGILDNKPIWTSISANATRSVIWGDVDSDGDLDLAVGNANDTENEIYLNKTFESNRVANLTNNWSYIENLRLTRVDSALSTYTFKYLIYDDESDECWIRTEYSPLGGGKWYPATGENKIHLSSSPTGVSHDFVWDAGADDADGLNVMFRMSVFSNPDRTGLIQRASTSYQIPIGLIDSKPHVSIIYPPKYAFVGGIVPIIGRIWDATNFDHYAIKMDNELLYESSQTQPRITVLYSLDSSQLPTGQKIIKIEAIDKKDNQRIVTIPVNIVSSPEEPIVSLRFPDNNSENVALNSPIIAQFNSNMNSVTLTCQTMIIRDANQLPISGDVDYNYHTHTLTFVPAESFMKNSFYYITIDSSFQNEVGNLLNVNTVWGFTTENRNALFDHIETVPANGFVGVPVSDSVQVILDPSSSYQLISMHNLEGEVVEGETIIKPPIGSIQKRIIIFKPKSNLSGAMLYLVSVCDTLTKDAGKYTFYFITKDVETLEITNTRPNNGEIISPLNFEISATFNKDMNPNILDSTTVLLTKAEQRISTFISYIVEKKKVLITPQNRLDQNATYSVTIDGMVQSRGGLSLGSDFVWQFHTAQIITADGGVVTSIDGMVEMEFPPNALTEDIPIIIIQKDTVNLERFKPTEPQLGLLSYPYEFQPLPLTFKKTVILRMKTVIDKNLSTINSKNLAIFKWDEVNRIWLRIGGTVSLKADTVSVTTTLMHLDKYYAILEDRGQGEKFSLKNINSQPRIFSPQGGGFDTQTAISFELGKESIVTIKVYNAAGRLVKVLKENEQMSRGNNVVYWDGKDQQGNFCLSGLYIVTIQAEEKIATKTVVVLNK